MCLVSRSRHTNCYDQPLIIKHLLGSIVSGWNLLVWWLKTRWSGYDKIRALSGPSRLNSMV